MQVKAYKMLKQSELEKEASPGAIVHQHSGLDYGTAADDTYLTGIEHISVTLKRDHGPFFTVPLRDIEEVTVDMPDPPTDDETKTFCKVGQGASCCRYLTMSAAGWSCEKLTEIGRHLDDRVSRNDMVAQGDNCEGKGSR